MTTTPQELVEVLGHCTEDIRDCEIMRLAIALKDSESDNETAQAIRREVAKSACQDCVVAYLADIK